MASLVKLIIEKVKEEATSAMIIFPLTTTLILLPPKAPTPMHTDTHMYL